MSRRLLAAIAAACLPFALGGCLGGITASQVGTDLAVAVQVGEALTPVLCSSLFKNAQANTYCNADGTLIGQAGTLVGGALSR